MGLHNRMVRRGTSTKCVRGKATSKTRDGATSKTRDGATSTEGVRGRTAKTHAAERTSSSRLASGLLSPRLVSERRIFCGSCPLHKPYSKSLEINSIPPPSSFLLSLSSSMTMMRIIARQCAGTMEMILLGSMQAPRR